MLGGSGLLGVRLDLSRSIWAGNPPLNLSLTYPSVCYILLSRVCKREIAVSSCSQDNFFGDSFSGEGDTGNKVRTTSDDAGGKSVSEKSKSAGAKCVSENSTGGKSGGRLVREQIGNVETRMQDSMVLHTEYVPDYL